MCVYDFSTPAKIKICFLQYTIRLHTYYETGYHARVPRSFCIHINLTKGYNWIPYLYGSVSIVMPKIKLAVFLVMS